jgi:hypothetical protein
MNMLVLRVAARRASGGRIAQQAVVWPAKRGRDGTQGIGERLIPKRKSVTAEESL